jgi:hypothetical protein
MHSTVTKLLAPLDSISSYEPAGSGGAAGGDEDSASSSIGAGEQAGPGQARSVFSQAKWFRVVAEDGLAISEGEDPSSGRKELKYAQGELVEALQVRRAGGRPERHRQGGPPLSTWNHAAGAAPRRVLRCIRRAQALRLEGVGKKGARHRVLVVCGA